MTPCAWCGRRAPMSRWPDRPWYLTISVHFGVWLCCEQDAQGYLVGGCFPAARVQAAIARGGGGRAV